MRTTILVLALVVIVAICRAQTTGPSTQPASRPSTVLEPVKEGTTQPAGIPTAQYRDGTLLGNLVGRIAHEKNGAPAFVFEAGGKMLRMQILPNTMLERMEATAESNSSTRFRVTGRVTDYRGLNHILIQEAVVVPDEH